MRQIPMLFSPAMIEALRDGRKTETRRVLNPKTDSGLPFDPNDVGFTAYHDGPDGLFFKWFSDSGDMSYVKVSARSGDLIWVREAHMAYGYCRTIPDTFTKGGKPKREFVRDWSKAVHFDEGKKLIHSDSNDGIHGWYARPGMFMHKADSRMTMRVTGYRIERLHNIDRGGAISEGIEMHHKGHDGQGVFVNYQKKSDGFGGSDGPRDSYRTLWNAINGPDAWEQNPWVSVTQWGEVMHQNVLEVVA